MSFKVLMVLWRVVEDHDTLFVLAEISHFLGIGMLAYKLFRKKSVAGDSDSQKCLLSVTGCVIVLLWLR